jgi:acyl-coenzyme A thioesterase PaaI-like protein
MPSNRLSRAVTLINKLPHALHTPALSLLFGSQVKFAGTAKVRVHQLTPNRADLSLANRRKVQNHINGVHAAAMALLAESATGFLVGMNVPDDKLPLIKSLKVDYLKRATGALHAAAILTPEQIEAIRTQEKGEVLVAVSITDEAGIEPIRCEMLWAWVSKKR